MTEIPNRIVAMGKLELMARIVELERRLADAEDAVSVWRREVSQKNAEIESLRTLRVTQERDELTRRLSRCLCGAADTRKHADGCVLPWFHLGECSSMEPAYIPEWPHHPCDRNSLCAFARGHQGDCVIYWYSDSEVLEVAQGYTPVIKP